MTELALADLNKTKPALPDELLRFPLDDIDILDFPAQLEILWTEVFAELSDIRWSAHNISTYNRGCRGPLCKKARREDGRRKREIESQAERTYWRLDPIIEYYQMIAKLRLSNYRRERLSAIKAAG